MTPTLEYFGTLEHLAWDADYCYCVCCGSTRHTVDEDALYLGVADPVCCEVGL